MNKTLKRVLVFLIALAMLIGMLIGFSAVVFAEMRMIPAPLDAGNIGGDSDFDFDPGGWDGGGWDSDYDGGGTFFFTGSTPMIAIIAVVIFIVITILRKKGGGKFGGTGTVTPTTRQISPEHSANIAN